jgi:hypothetical protein
MTWDMDADTRYTCCNCKEDLGVYDVAKKHDCRNTKDDGTLREFITGATRDTAKGKLEPYGFISPLALHAFSIYMDDHRKQSDGNLRDSDNWQKGFPRDSYRQSLARHFMDWWLVSRGHEPRFGGSDSEGDILCAILFNVQGLLHEKLLGRDVDK